MLFDIERKVLRVIGNFTVGRGRMPTIKELCIKTSRTRQGIMEVLHGLKRQAYIEWDSKSPDGIVLLGNGRKLDLGKENRTLSFGDISYSLPIYGERRRLIG